MNFEELIEEELEQLDNTIEEAKKRVQVSHDGSKKKVASRKTQRKRGRKTRGMSAAARSRAAKKAAKTRSKDSSGQKKANRKRKKAMKIRRRKGL